MRWRVPVEVMCGLIEKPIPESDQFMLSYLFSRVLKGYETPLSLLGFSVSTSQSLQVETDSHWSHLREHPELRSVLVKMGNHDYQLRYPSLKEAIEAIDGALAPRLLSVLIPAQGLPLEKAWPILRPVFLQVQEYHRQGLCSGCFGIGDVEVPADGQARLTRFSSEESILQIKAAQSHQCQVIEKSFKFPCEVRLGEVNEPLPASDQPLLARILAQMLGGVDRKEWRLFFGHDSSEPRWGELYAPLFGKATYSLSRLTRFRPEDRFPQVSDAIADIDAILLKETT